jgi:hypothetical protein
MHCFAGRQAILDRGLPEPAMVGLISDSTAVVNDYTKRTYLSTSCLDVQLEDSARLSKNGSNNATLQGVSRVSDAASNSPLSENEIIDVLVVYSLLQWPSIGTCQTREAVRPIPQLDSPDEKALAPRNKAGNE